MIIKQKQHITQFLILALAAVLVLPSVVKFSHVLSEHEHEVCVDANSSHFHELDIDCEFYKFKLNTNYYTSLELVEINPNEHFNSSEHSYDVFVPRQDRSSTSKRGPPVLI